MDSDESEKKFYSLQKLVNTYKLLEKRSPPTDQEYVIYAYFLYSEPKDGVYGKQIFLGAYPTKRKALEELDVIIRKTGHDCIYVTESCYWQDIDERKRPDRTLYMDPDTHAKELEEQYRHKILKESEQQEKRDMITRELEEQAEKELDPTTIEYYAHNWFNAIKNKSSYEYHKEQMNHYEKMFNKRADKIRQQYQDQPEYEDKWLDLYKYRLTRRGEEDIFIMMREGHKALVDEILDK
jgi:hypothetical protein